MAEGRRPGRPKGSGVQKKPEKLIQYRPKYWKKAKYSYYDAEEVTFRLENNLPLDDLIDKFKGKYESKNDDKDV